MQRLPRCIKVFEVGSQHSQLRTPKRPSRCENARLRRATGSCHVAVRALQLTKGACANENWVKSWMLTFGALSFGGDRPHFVDVEEGPQYSPSDRASFEEIEGPPL
jgi:hypothetical protein